MCDMIGVQGVCGVITVMERGVCRVDLEGVREFGAIVTGVQGGCRLAGEVEVARALCCLPMRRCILLILWLHQK